MAESTLMEQALRQGEFIKEVWRISGVAMRMEAGGKDQKVDKNNRELTSVQNGTENRAQELSAQALESGRPGMESQLSLTSCGIWESHFLEPQFPYLRNGNTTTTNIHFLGL